MIHLTADHKVTVCFLAFLTDSFPIKDSFVNVARNMPNFNVTIAASTLYGVTILLSPNSNGAASRPRIARRKVNGSPAWLLILITGNA